MAATATRDDWRTLAEQVGIPRQAFIDGRRADALRGETFDCISPIDGRLLARVASCDAADVDVAVAGARRAFDSGVWSRSAPKERKRLLLRLAGLIREHADELALLETLDMGKPITDARTVDVRLAAECIQYYGEAIDKVYDEIAPTGPDVVSLIYREPLGVVAAVVPWNFPLLMAAWKLGPALATGNSVVLKPAEQSPLTALRLGELAAEAGLPAGVLQVVPGDGPGAGAPLGLHPDVDMVTFTGSTEVGKLFLRYAGESNMKRVALECGGKSPHIVLPDCGDLAAAASAAAWGVFYNQGEVCNAGSRLLVHRDVKDEFMELLLAEAAQIRPADPLDPTARLGAMVDETQTERVLAYIDSGRAAGAELILGGARVRAETGGSYIEPTIFDRVSNDMTIAREEIFGPVLATIDFASEDEAVAIANDTIYGLAAAVWTDNVDRAHRVARAIRAGVVWVNTFDAGDITSPFGGFKQSGFGRDKSMHALEKYADLKTVWISLRR
jgi:gamma-glutamyl-gamma-aminobutyraldehyde dehydrogenase/4-guanidinobutyraldehyde dehydrogenase/NAD-dependent aldehyde dehydrogenase